MVEEFLKALVVYPNKKTEEIRSLINIACSVAKKIERTSEDICVKAIKYVPEVGVFVAIYVPPDKRRSIKPFVAKGAEKVGSE